MNLILIHPSELADPVLLSGPRAAHIHSVLKPAPGDLLKIGVVNGLCGKAQVLATTPESASLRVLNLDETPPAPWCNLILALPRPRAMKRLWPQLATLGVRDIHLLNADKVEKTYFASHATDPETYTPLLLDGLMQAGATAMPGVHIHPRFSTFIEKTLPALITPATLPLLAHPGPATDFQPLSTSVDLCREGSTEVDRGRPQPLLAVGPDGGWTPGEHAAFLAAGFHPFSLGERPLRTDMACVALLATLHYLLNK